MNDLVPLNIPAPALGTLLASYRYLLFPGDAYQHVDAHTLLMPAPAALACVAELDRQLKAMTRNEALALTEQLLSYFPHTATNHDPKAKAIFLTGLVDILTQHPLAAGQTAVKWVRDNKTFLHHADLAQACEQQTRELRIARGLAKAHADEAERRAGQAQSSVSPEEKAEIADLLAKAASRLRLKSASSGERDASARKSAIKAMSDDEFHAYMKAEQERMAAEEPAYRARMANAGQRKVAERHPR